MINIACQRPVELGYAQELWTLNSLHKHIQKHAEEAGYPRLSTVTKPYIQKFLKKQDIKPFKIKYYCEKRDPDFESKMHEYSAHTSKETQRFLNTMPKGRFKFVFTPKHGAWLNMIEVSLAR